MEGIALINKESGITSHDVVALARKRLRMKRIGHAGTLDPLATGVLLLLIGRATKLFEKFAAMDKAYQATLILGKRTVSADILGKTIETRPVEGISVENIKTAFAHFTGEIEQVPPMVSAIKFKGKKLYELARSGIVVDREARRVTVHRLILEQFESPHVRFSMTCSKGTYVRQLAEDIGAYLGCGACIAQIERTRIGPFTLEEAVTIKELDESHIQRWEDQARYS